MSLNHDRICWNNGSVENPTRARAESPHMGFFGRSSKSECKPGAATPSGTSLSSDPSAPGPSGAGMPAGEPAVGAPAMGIPVPPGAPRSVPVYPGPPQQAYYVQPYTSRGFFGTLDSVIASANQDLNNFVYGRPRYPVGTTSTGHWAPAPAAGYYAPPPYYPPPPTGAAAPHYSAPMPPPPMPMQYSAAQPAAPTGAAVAPSSSLPPPSQYSGGGGGAEVSLYSQQHLLPPSAPTSDSPAWTSQSYPSTGPSGAVPHPQQSAYGSPSAPNAPSAYDKAPGYPTKG